MATSKLGIISRQDLNKWDGRNKTFSRRSPTGGTLTLNKYGYEIDVLMSYGDGTEYTDASISKAITAIGSTDKRCLLLNPGTWTISNNLTITSNFTLKCPPGVDLAVSTGVTLTIQGPIEAGPYQIYSGSGTVTISGVQIIHDQWADASGNAYFPSVDNSIDLGTSTYEFKDIYSDGVIYTDGVSLANDITPETDDDSDLGTSTYQFKDLHLDGVAYLDNISLDGDIDPGENVQARLDDSDYITVTIRDGDSEIIHEVPLSQAFSPESGWV